KGQDLLYGDVPIASRQLLRRHQAQLICPSPTSGNGILHRTTLPDVAIGAQSTLRTGLKCPAHCKSHWMGTRNWSNAANSLGRPLGSEADQGRRQWRSARSRSEAGAARLQPTLRVLSIFIRLSTASGPVRPTLRFPSTFD